ncbi:MAG: glutaminyl-peptide cyclotransferase [Pseudomonadota bacterium]
MAAQEGARPEVSDAGQAAQKVELFIASVVAAYPHDDAAFTQGLLWHEGWLYESTGRVGTSTIRKVDLETGKVAQLQPIPADQFGEGLALWEDELISLTWRDGAVHRWSLADLSPVSTYTEYPYEGWGLAPFGDTLVASDGSNVLRFLNPHDYRVTRAIEVTFQGQPLSQLNELEVIDGMIFANVWKTGYIVGIDAQTGAVRKLIDARNLPGRLDYDPEAVLNGIAWDAGGKRLFVTGKLWPQLYHIELKPRGVLE